MPGASDVPGTSPTSTDAGSKPAGESSTASQPHDASRPTADVPLEKQKPKGLWSVEFGVGIISDNTPANYLSGKFEALNGPGGGLTYNLTVARQIKEFDWHIGKKIELHPQLEVPFMLTFVDDKVQGVIPDINLGLVFRWKDFPWNRILSTSFAAGVGLSYSFKLWTADIQRHPGDDRSRMKFWLPIEFTVALPQFPNYQVTAFVDHQSGGTLFDRGGVDAWGLGFRVVF